MEGQSVENSEHICPMIHCLPMGFSWAMWFVQQVSVSHTKEVIPESHLVRDGRPAPDIRGGELQLAPIVTILGSSERTQLTC